MDDGSADYTRKRMRPGMDEEEVEVGSDAMVEAAEEDETETAIVVSEEMKHDIDFIHEKIEFFTQMVSELLESGNTVLKDLKNEFEERIIMIHKEQMEILEDEIKELRLIDSSNEEINSLLHNARYLLQNLRGDRDS